MTKAPRLTVVFPTFAPFMARKDVGMIPSVMRRCFGWNTQLVVSERTQGFGPSTPGLDPAVQYTTVGDYRGRITTSVRLAQRLVQDPPDAVLLYHLTSDSLALAHTVKLRSPKTVIALKLDIDERAVSALTREHRGSKLRLLECALRLAPIDFLTVETRAAAEALRAISARRWRKPLLHMPNGVDPPQVPARAQPEPWILTTGRLGMPQKNTEALLDAFIQVGPEKLGSWKLVMAGDYAPAFRLRIDSAVRRHPWLNERLETRDWITGHEEMATLYEQSAVYCLPSRWESFGLVVTEALMHGCYVIATPVGVAPEVIDDACGQVVPVGSAENIANALRRVVTSEVDLSAARAKARERARAYYWSSVLVVLDRELRARIG